VARTALVLTETASGKVEEIARQVKHVDGIKAVHVITESYGIITSVEAGSSVGIRDAASKLALIPGVVRCVVCSERELTGSAETYGFTGMTDDNFLLVCQRAIILVRCYFQIKNDSDHNC